MVFVLWGIIYKAVNVDTGQAQPGASGEVTTAPEQTQSHIYKYNVLKPDLPSNKK